MVAVADIMKQPWVWGVVGVLALGGAAFAATRGGGDGPSLEDARIEAATDSVRDTEDQDDQGLGGTTPDATPPSLAEPLTFTATDLGDPGAVRQLSGFAESDPDEECLWLVNLPEEDPASLFIVAWPEGTEIVWAPFSLTVPTSDGDVTTAGDDLLLFDATVHDSLATLDASDFARLEGAERCGHDGIVVIEDDPDAVSFG